MLNDIGLWYFDFKLIYGDYEEDSKSFLEFIDGLIFISYYKDWACKIKAFWKKFAGF